MKFLVACNWDPALLDQINHPEVSSLFGGLPDSVISSGRPSSQVRPVSRDNVRKYIARVHEKGWAFDYNVNSSCLGNLEVTRKGFRAIVKFLESVVALGVDELTVANTNLIGIVKKHFPKVRVNLSTYQKVTEVAQARRFEDMGVDLIMLSEHVNRDFKALRAIRKAVKCQLALIANVGCVYDCPNALTHANSNAHSGAKGQNALFADPFMVYCFGKRLESPEEAIKIRWIRPEDVGHYEDVGIDVLKILERNSTTETLVERVRTYCQRSYDGNILSLLGQMIDVKRSKGRQKELHIKRFFSRPSLSGLRDMKRGRDFSGLFASPVHELLSVDNKKLPADFIKSFEVRDCRASDCRTCGNCKAMAAKAVRVLDQAALDDRRRILRQAVDEIRMGTSLF
jgi:collagenase-like PrtC family protease